MTSERCLFYYSISVNEGSQTDMLLKITHYVVIIVLLSLAN